MEENTLRNVRVLVVEDNVEQLEGIKRDLQRVDRDRRLTLGIDSFECNLAASVEEATGFLESIGPPCDILILDLGLPEKRGSNEAVENGYQLLERAREKVREVVIVSGFREYENVIKAVRQGAVDFVAKPFRTDLLQARVLESWKRILEKDAALLLVQRVRELVPYAENGAAHSFDVRLSSLLEEMSSSVDNIESHARERFGLDRRKDSNDYLIRSLANQRETLDRAKMNWSEFRPTFLPLSELLRSETVGMLLLGIRESLLPCLLIKNVRLVVPGSAGLPIVTSQDDVRAILKEIVMGGLAELPDYPQTVNQIEVNVGIKQGQIEVTFVDKLAPIARDQASRINRFLGVAPNGEFWRAWGLSIMQHIALRGGGRLTVTPNDQQGNVVTYLIPLGSS
jgi:DNA-binding response OmpR family regulator